MIEIKAPYPVDFSKPTLFLSGSIEMGSAEKWQERIVKELKDWDGIILNPRRDDWDSSWIQSIDNPKFREQVEWELRGLEDADLAIVCFDPTTKSPITLMELGIISGYAIHTWVVCPPGFWRRGNVEILCARYPMLHF